MNLEWPNTRKFQEQKHVPEKAVRTYRNKSQKGKKSDGNLSDIKTTKPVHNQAAVSDDENFVVFSRYYEHENVSFLQNEDQQNLSLNVESRILKYNITDDRMNTRSGNHCTSKNKSVNKPILQEKRLHVQNSSKVTLDKNSERNDDFHRINTRSFQIQKRGITLGEEISAIEDSDDSDLLHEIQSEINTNILAEDDEIGNPEILIEDRTNITRSFIHPRRRCSHCPKVLSSSYYKIHKKNHFRIDNDVKVECEICQKKFLSKTILKIHKENIHEKIRHFGCEQCGKPYYRRGDKDLHVSATHDNVRYVCGQCEKKYRHRSSLSFHSKSVHEVDNTPYVCTICEDKSFPYKSTLAQHMESHSRLVDKEGGKKHFKLPRKRCSTCLEEFSVPYISRHKRQEHSKVLTRNTTGVGKSNIVLKLKSESKSATIQSKVQSRVSGDTYQIQNQDMQPTSNIFDARERNSFSLESMENTVVNTSRGNKLPESQIIKVQGDSIITNNQANHLEIPSPLETSVNGNPDISANSQQNMQLSNRELERTALRGHISNGISKIVTEYYRNSKTNAATASAAKNIPAEVVSDNKYGSTESDKQSAERNDTFGTKSAEIPEDSKSTGLNTSNQVIMQVTASNENPSELDHHIPNKEGSLDNSIRTNNKTQTPRSLAMPIHQRFELNRTRVNIYEKSFLTKSNTSLNPDETIDTNAKVSNSNSSADSSVILMRYKLGSVPITPNIVSKHIQNKTGSQQDAWPTASNSSIAANSRSKSNFVIVKNSTRVFKLSNQQSITRGQARSSTSTRAAQIRSKVSTRSQNQITNFKETKMAASGKSISKYCVKVKEQVGRPKVNGNPITSSSKNISKSNSSLLVDVVEQDESEIYERIKSVKDKAVRTPKKLSSPAKTGVTCSMPENITNSKIAIEAVTPLQANNLSYEINTSLPHKKFSGAVFSNLKVPIAKIPLPEMNKAGETMSTPNFKNMKCSKRNFRQGIEDSNLNSFKHPKTITSTIPNPSPAFYKLSYEINTSLPHKCVYGASEIENLDKSPLLFESSIISSKPLEFSKNSVIFNFDNSQKDKTETLTPPVRDPLDHLKSSCHGSYKDKITVSDPKDNSKFEFLDSLKSGTINQPEIPKNNTSPAAPPLKLKPQLASTTTETSNTASPTILQPGLRHGRKSPWPDDCIFSSLYNKHWSHDSPFGSLFNSKIEQTPGIFISSPVSSTSSDSDSDARKITSCTPFTFSGMSEDKISAPVELNYARYRFSIQEGLESGTLKKLNTHNLNSSFSPSYDINISSSHSSGRTDCDIIGNRTKSLLSESKNPKPPKPPAKSRFPGSTFVEAIDETPISDSDQSGNPIFLRIFNKPEIWTSDPYPTPTLAATSTQFEHVTIAKHDLLSYERTKTSPKMANTARLGTSSCKKGQHTSGDINKPFPKPRLNLSCAVIFGTSNPETIVIPPVPKPRIKMIQTRMEENKNIGLLLHDKSKEFGGQIDKNTSNPASDESYGDPSQYVEVLMHSSSSEDEVHSPCISSQFSKC